MQAAAQKIPSGIGGHDARDFARFGPVRWGARTANPDMDIHPIRRPRRTLGNGDDDTHGRQISGDAGSAPDDG